MPTVSQNLSLPVRTLPRLRDTTDYLLWNIQNQKAILAMLRS